MKISNILYNYKDKVYENLVYLPKILIMKKIILLLFLTGIIGCKSTSIVNTKLDNKTERMLKGNWTLSAVNFPGSDYLTVKSFKLDDSKCFIGSQWNFISNNNKGYFTLNSATCKSFSSPIKWYVNKDGEFVLKIINNYKAKEVNTGFVLKLKNVTATSFELIDNIDVSGSINNITYTFLKN